MEELGLKTGKPKMWLRRVLVILFALGDVSGLFVVVPSFWSFVLVDGHVLGDADGFTCDET